MNCDQEPKPEDFGLTECNMCDFRKQIPMCMFSDKSCLCKGSGWLLNKKPADDKDIARQFKHLREARGQWD
jgi:hypothetical protein